MGTEERISHAPTAMGRCPSAPQSIYAYTLCHRTTKFDVVCGEGVYLGVSHASHPKTAEFQRYSIFGVLLFSCLDPSTQNNQIRGGIRDMERGMLLLI